MSPNLNQPPACDMCPYQRRTDKRIDAMQHGVDEAHNSATAAETVESFVEMETVKTNQLRKIEQLISEKIEARATCYGPYVYRPLGFIGKNVIECTSPAVKARHVSEWRANLRK